MITRFVQRLIDTILPPFDDVLRHVHGKATLTEVIVDDPAAEVISTGFKRQPPVPDGVDIAQVTWSAPECAWRAALLPDGTFIVYDEENEAWVPAP